MRWPALCLALVFAGTATGRAEGRPARVEEPAKTDPVDPTKVLDVSPTPAGTVALLPTSARRYAQARRLLARGKPAQALAALRGSQAQLIDDRESLLKGDALLALGNKDQAKEQYLHALSVAQIRSVAVGAARGLVDVLGQLGERDQQLLYLDALLAEKWIPRRSDLQYRRAEVLVALSREEEAANVCWRILLDHPSGAAAKKAQQLLERLKRKGIKTPVTSSSLELVRIKNLVSAGAFSEGERALDALAKKVPAMGTEVELERAELCRRRHQKSAEQEVLEHLLAKNTLSGGTETKVLARLGRIAMAKDDDKAAIDYFDRLRAKYPADRDAIEGQYLAGWIPYNAGNFEESTRRMLEFAEEHPRAERRTEALWFAGWAAYLDKRDGLARRSFQQILEDHPQSTLAPTAHYWLGRIQNRAGDTDKAREEYREVLKVAPLSYYGFWSMERLRELGEETVLTAPPPEPTPPSLAKLVEMLGVSRPVLIDRAVALHAAGLQNDALDELTACASYLRRGRDTKGRTMVADLLDRLGAHNLAFRVALLIAQDGAELVTGEPWAWRAWRHAYPRAFPDEVAYASKAHQVDDALILSIMRTESHFRPNVTSPVGARGLMQLMPATADRIGKRVKGGRSHSARFRDPRSNVWLGAWYLGTLMARYGNRIELAAGAYNAGPGAMDEWVKSYEGMPMDEFVERIPYRETRRYVRRVMETYLIYLRLSGQALPKLDTTVSKMSLTEAEGVSF